MRLLPRSKSSVSILMVTSRAFLNLLAEAKVLTPDRGSEPIMKGDVIRVYHGFRETEDALLAATQGLSGKVRADRVYSYEADNNPKGLFVSTNLKDAKEFTGAYEELATIMEFHAHEADLEIPAWPTGGYVGQGGMAGTWDHEDPEQARKGGQERRIQQIMKDAESQGLDWVLQSDRPDLAWFLQMGGENQALFTGDLDPNSVRAFWVRPKDPETGYQMVNSPFQRLSRAQFLKTFSKHHPKGPSWEQPRDNGKGYGFRPEKRYRKNRAVFSPREEFDPKLFVQRVAANNGDTPEEMLKTMKGLATSRGFDSDVISDYIWPRQKAAADAWWASLKQA